MPTNQTLTVETLRRALEAVPGREGSGSALEQGIISGLTVRGQAVGFVVDDIEASDEDLARIHAAAEAAARSLPGVERVAAIQGRGSARPATPTSGAAPRPKGGGSQRVRMDGVRHVVAVASGKGGVGKSTIAANLAAAAAARGVRVGLLDLDIYGPSVPTLMGLEGADPALNKEGRLVPPVAHGVKAMSMGFMVPADRAMIWRGPIIMSAVQQLLRDVDWGELDILFLDLPPGTGDVQLTLVQRLAMDGAIIVSTPQKLALADVRRGVRMFRDTAVPILGVIENMSAITDPVTGQRFAPFGEGGARDAARELEAPFLGSLAMTPALAEASDLGIPVASDATSALGVWFAETVEAIMAMLQQNTPPQPPTIRFVN